MKNIAITKESVIETLTAKAKAIGLTNSVSGSEYGKLIAMTALHFGLNQATPLEFLTAFAGLWEHTPKNPSAMRQSLFEKTESVTKAVDVSAMMLAMGLNADGTPLATKEETPSATPAKK